MRKIVVLSADIINSRKQENFEENIQKSLPLIQNDTIIAPFSLLRGDEIQGVLNSVDSLPEVVRELRYHCLPLKLRVGIGIGQIDDNKLRNNSWEMNGKPFYLARQPLDLNKKTKNPITTLNTEDYELDKVINCIWSLIDVLQQKWSKERWRAVQLYEKGGTFELASKKYGGTPQNIHKLVKEANWEHIKNAEIILKKLLCRGC